MKKNIFFFIIILFHSSVYSQKESYMWYFGGNAGLDFHTSPPTAITNSVMLTYEGSSSISDANGNLLFYTDGTYVWNRNHTLMPNGDSLMGGTSSTQSALILPYPGNSTLYYIFTVQPDDAFLNSDFRYSIVNMSLDGGNGDIIIKNVFINSPVSEKLSAVRHSNGIDIWVIVHGSNNNSLLAYLITSSGINLTPVTSNIGQTVSGFDRRGYMKFSPDGTKLAFVGLSSYIDLFDFNSTSGIITNEKYLPLNGLVYGVEFSLSGNFLYGSTTAPGTISQWDLTSNSAPIINASIQQIGITSSTGFGALQMGPDGKIYAAQFQDTYLGVINSPELQGMACNFANSGISLLGQNCYLGLPNFIQSYFLSTGISEINYNSSPHILIYPNVSSSVLNITLKKKQQIQIINLFGEVLFQTNDIAIGHIEIDISRFTSGVYFLKGDNEGIKFVKK